MDSPKRSKREILEAMKADVKRFKVTLETPPWIFPGHIFELDEDDNEDTNVN